MWVDFSSVALPHTHASTLVHEFFQYIFLGWISGSYHVRVVHLVLDVFLR